MGEIRVRVNSYGPGRCWGMVYIDPTSGKKVAKSTGVPNTGKKSQREAERVAGDWQTQLQTGKYKAPSKMTWAEFRERYEAERLPALSRHTSNAWDSAANHVERLLAPDLLRKMTTVAVAEFCRKLRAEGMKETTLGTHLRHLKSALNWAVKLDLLAECPRFDMPKAGGAKSRPVTAEEFDRMLAAVPKVRPDDAEVWIRYLRGLWLSGLRLEESLALSWDQDAAFAVDLSGRRPVFRIDAEAQKSRRAEVVPIVPDLAEFLLATPPEDREGPVFPMPVAADAVSRIVARIGKKAGVVVSWEGDKVKTATAHDLRRSFGTRWAKRLMPALLRKIMRHASIDTTMKYYVGLEAEDVAEELWAGFGNTNGNTRQDGVSDRGSRNDASPCETRACTSRGDRI